MRSWLRENSVYAIALLIAVLLACNIYLIYRNAQQIEHNQNLYQEAEQVKSTTVDVVRNLHLLDMALRSYALVKQPHFLTLADSCIDVRESIFRRLESALDRQGYEMHRFRAMKDSVDAYYQVIDVMRGLLRAGRVEEFRRVLAPDPGYAAWAAFVPFSDHVFAFESAVSARAEAQYRRALKNSYWLQVVIFMIAVPTLGYTAYYTRRSLRFSRNVNASMRENLHSVAQQKAVLERMVEERTREIMEQKEEIAARNEQLLLHQREIEVQRNEMYEQNEELQNAKRIIELQHREIKKRHDVLALEVDRRTRDLKKTNIELVEHNNRLEQFTYIISHNLRAPMARLTGLASLLHHSEDSGESQKIIQLMVRSTGELDQVIRDLGVILGVQRTGSVPVEEIDLECALQKVVNILEPEIADTGATIERDLKVRNFYSLPPYIDSILYNLISNALKYRHPDRAPQIVLTSKMQNKKIRIDVLDNGLGIDLEKNSSNLFNLYKRFHFHVEGKGLGLYLVKTQVMALGGTIDVKSRVDEGTTFTLLFNQRLNGESSNPDD